MSRNYLRVETGKPVQMWGSEGSRNPSFDYVSADVEIPFEPLTSKDHGGFGFRYHAAEAVHDLLHSHDNQNVVEAANYVREGVICCWVTAAIVILILDILDVGPLFSGEDDGPGGIILIVLTVFFAVCTLCCFLLNRAFSTTDGNLETVSSS